jgi:sugar lactone lactonase YvrE
MHVSLRGAWTVPTYLLLSAILTPVGAQVPEQRLTTPAASFPKEFAAIRGLLELPDGRVLVADGLGQALMVVDLAMGSADTVGRVGQGPEEYRSPDGLYPLPGDSILLVDLGNGRLTRLGPDLGFGETMPLAQGDPTTGMGMSLRIPAGVDGEGRIYFQGRGGMRPGALPDSGMVLRWDPKSGAVDTLATVKLPEMRQTTSGGRNNQSVSISAVPLSPQDGWAVAPDGRVAVVRTNPYRVDWALPGGRIVSGPTNEYKPVGIGNAEKNAYLDNRQRDGLQVLVSVENGRRNMNFARGGGPSGERDLDAYEWPEVMPVIDPSGVRVSSDGYLWVKRYLKVGVPPTFDVFDRDGELVKRIILPDRREVVGFGKGVVYLARIDEFDLQWLEKYELK